MFASYISDRTVLDCAAFWLYRELQGLLPLDAPKRNRYFEEVDGYLAKKPYDLIVLLENGAFPWADDGFRIEDQEAMNALLIGAYVLNDIGDTMCPT